MSLRVLLTAALATACLDSAAPPDDASARKADQLTINELSMEVAALQGLYLFDFTRPQLEMLQKLAEETVEEPGRREKPTVSDAFRQTLRDLHAALVEGDEERIEELQDRLDALKQAENPELDDGIEVSEAAAEHAPEVLRALGARQLAGFVAAYGDEFPDPLELIEDALANVRSMDAKTWKSFRETVPDQIGRLVAGLDAEKASRVADEAAQLLIQTRLLKPEEYQKRRGELEAEGRKLASAGGPLKVINNVAEEALAELLSNPRLPTALKARLAR